MVAFTVKTRLMSLAGINKAGIVYSDRIFVSFSSTGGLIKAL